MKKLRTGITVGLSAACALSLAACSAGGSGEAITLASWGGVYSDEMYEAYAVPFTEETGITVLEDGPVDYAKAKAQVESGNVSWDVISTEPFWSIAECGTLLEPIADKLDTSEVLDDTLSDCGIPADLMTYVLAYDTEAFGGDAPTSWADFFDTERFPGKRGVWNYAPGGALEVALLADGVTPDELYPLDTDRAYQKLDEIVDDIAFYDTGAQQVQQMESGEVVMTIAWNGRAFDAMSNGATFAPVWKDNLRLVNQVSVLKGTQNLDAAVEFIQTLISTGPQTAFAEALPYSPINVNANPSIDEATAMWSASEPEAFDQGFFIDQQYWADNYSANSEAWTQWSAG